MQQAPSPLLPDPAALPWQQGFAQLGPAFYASVRPTPLPAPSWVASNPALGAELGLPPGWNESRAYLEVFAGNADRADALASVYSGHQFGVWAGQLGDGRALLLGELEGLEVQLKGAGRTPFSRNGDGRAVLRSSIREYLACVAMRGLGIPTTQALCLTASAQPVQRETLETAAVLTRVAPSFVRFGHFEHFCYSGQTGELQALADYVIARYFPQCSAGTQWSGNAYAALLAEVCTLSAALVAQWQAIGFCHGVLNTDNMSILGLTLDYGPFQFLDAYDPAHICNHSDHGGRYAFARQPDIVHWNLYGLAQALLPLIESQELAMEILQTFPVAYQHDYLSRMARKLGLPAADASAAQALLAPLRDLLAAQAVDYTIFWRHLSHWTLQQDKADRSVHELFREPAAYERWLANYQPLLAGQDRAAWSHRMLACNPKYVLRNHIAETAIRAAKRDDFSTLAQLQTVLEQPFDEHPQAGDWADFPPDWAQHIAISCSS